MSDLQVEAEMDMTIFQNYDNARRRLHGEELPGQAAARPRGGPEDCALVWYLHFLLKVLHAFTRYHS